MPDPSRLDNQSSLSRLRGDLASWSTDWYYWLEASASHVTGLAGYSDRLAKYVR